MDKNRRFRRRDAGKVISEFSITEKSDMDIKDGWELLHIRFNTPEYTEEKLRSILSACGWTISLSEINNFTLVISVFATGMLAYYSHLLISDIYLYLAELIVLVLGILSMFYFAKRRVAKYRMTAEVVRNVLDQRLHNNEPVFVNNYYSGANIDQ